MLGHRKDGFIEENEGDKDRNREVLKKYSEVWNGIKGYIEKINNSKSGEYHKDYMKIQFNSDDNFPLNKQLNFLSLTIIIRNIFEKDGKYYSHFF